MLHNIQYKMRLLTKIIDSESCEKIQLEPPPEKRVDPNIPENSKKTTLH